MIVDTYLQLGSKLIGSLFYAHALALLALSQALCKDEDTMD